MHKGRRAVGLVGLLLAAAVSGCKKDAAKPDTAPPEDLSYTNMTPTNKVQGPVTQPSSGSVPREAAQGVATPTQGPAVRSGEDVSSTVVPAEPKPAIAEPPVVSPPPQPVVRENPSVRESPPVNREPVVAPTREVAVREAPKREVVARPEPAAPPAKPLDPAMRRTVLFRTNPPSAKVTLRSSDGKQVFPATRGTPTTIQVPPDVYTWEVELGGYFTERSVLNNQIDVTRSSADTITVTLTPAGDLAARYANGNKEFNDKRCAAAIEIYKSIDQPQEMSGEVGRTWLESRSRLAQCQVEMKKYKEAVATYTKVLEYEPWQWNAKYEMATALCLDRQFRPAANVYGDIEGPYLNRVPQDRRAAVAALSRYGRATCRYREWDISNKPESHPELMEPAIRLFDEFVVSAKALLQDPLPPEIKNTLSRAFADAQNKLKELRGS